MIWNSTRPRFTDAESGATGFGMFAIVVMLPGIGNRLYSMPGAALPVVGTENCGLPRNAIVSDVDSHGSIFGCSLKSVNHEHAPSAKSGSIAINRLALTANLLGSVLLEKLRGRVDTVR